MSDIDIFTARGGMYDCSFPRGDQSMSKIDGLWVDLKYLYPAAHKAMIEAAKKKDAKSDSSSDSPLETNKLPPSQ